MKQIHKNRLLPLTKSLPKLPSHLLITPPIRVLLLYEWFFRHLIHVLVHGAEEAGEHFLAVVLGEALELDGFPPNPRLNIPRRHIPRLPSIHLPHQPRKRLHKLPLRPIRIIPVYMVGINLQ